MISSKNISSFVLLVFGLGCLLIAAVTTATIVKAKDTAYLDGSVSVSTDDGTKPVQGAVVLIEGVSPELEPKHSPMVDQVDQTFEPHVLPTRTGVKVEFKNSEMTAHNVRLVRSENKKQLMNEMTFSGMKASYTFEQPGVVAVHCDIHPSMLSYVVVVDSPYLSTRTNDKGDFKLQLPAQLKSSFTVRSWTEVRGFSTPKQVSFDGDSQHINLVYSSNGDSE